MEKEILFSWSPYGLGMTQSTFYGSLNSLPPLSQFELEPLPALQTQIDETHDAEICDFAWFLASATTI